MRYRNDHYLGYTTFQSEIHPQFDLISNYSSLKNSLITKPQRMKQKFTFISVFIFFALLQVYSFANVIIISVTTACNSQELPGKILVVIKVFFKNNLMGICMEKCKSQNLANSQLFKLYPVPARDLFVEGKVNITKRFEGDKSIEGSCDRNSSKICNLRIKDGIRQYGFGMVN